MTAIASAVVLHPERCSRCGKCLRACPQGLLTMSSGYVCIDVAACDGCFSCGIACETGAITAGAVVANAQRRAVAKVRPRAAVKVPAQPGGAGGRRPWTLLDATAVSAVLLAAMLAKDAIVSQPVFSKLAPGFKTTALTSVLLGFYLVQLVALAFLARRHGRTLFSAFNDVDAQGRARRSAGSIALVMLMLVGTRMLSTAWGVLLMRTGFEAPRESGILTEVLGAGTFGVGLMIVTAVIVGPLVEEMVFRGVVASGLNERYGLVPAVLVSAGMFALYHVTPWLYLQMFALGCALAWLALTRRTLWPAVALHALYNGISVLVWLAG